MMILADGRWSGANGIGRFSREVLNRLRNTTILSEGPKPLSIKNVYWLPKRLRHYKKTHSVFFMPGFNPVSYSPIPFVFTICDLIHLKFPGRGSLFKKMYYEKYIKPRVYLAEKIITISEYSKNSIIEWTQVSADKIHVVYCGISENLTAMGNKHLPGYHYLLHVGNTKEHKNIPRLLEAFAIAKIDKGIRLVLTGEATSAIKTLISKFQLQQRIVFAGCINENQLADYYRGALALVFPSLCEGFGLPVLEAMACNTPVLTSNTSSLPEVAGSAALLIDPFSIEAMASGIENIIHDQTLRCQLMAAGSLQTQKFSWQKTADYIQNVLGYF